MLRKLRKYCNRVHRATGYFHIFSMGRDVYLYENIGLRFPSVCLSVRLSAVRVSNHPHQQGNEVINTLSCYYGLEAIFAY